MTLCFNSWVRMDHPPQSDRVLMPPLPETDDALRCMTVLPYLQDYHDPAPESDYGDDEVVINNFST